MMKNAKVWSIAGGYRPLMLLSVSGAQELPPGEVTADQNGAAAAPDGYGPLADRLARLAAAVEREHERAAHREAVIDRLHAEVQLLRRGELQAMFDPVRAALYRLHDLTRRESERWRDDPPDPAHAARLLGAVADEIAEALARTGIERFAVAPGEPFDPVRHRPVGVEPVTDPQQDGSVVRVRADGFAQGDRVVRKAEVCVGRPPADSPRPFPELNR
jgi:molecular chaperone GrpE (heat shock protein)